MQYDTDCVVCKQKSATWASWVQIYRRQITEKKMKWNDPGKQTLERQNSYL